MTFDGGHTHDGNNVTWRITKIPFDKCGDMAMALFLGRGLLR